MAQIPSAINGVAVEFEATVVNDVDQAVVDALSHCIKPNVANGHTLSKIFVSSASDAHVFPSRHAQKKAVDISRINGTKIVIGYPSNLTLKAIVDALQDTFETFSKRRENYGPHLKLKLGLPHPVDGHADHIHFSVN
jgi:hypothetical protein